MFDRIYIEISNICNLQCSFCPKLERKKKVMRADEFRKIAVQCAPLTKQIFLHLMGEPLLHSEFSEIVTICKELNLPIQITTNGTLLSKKNAHFLIDPIFRQINFSLQAAKDNFTSEQSMAQLSTILDFTKELHNKVPSTYINLRLWNLFDQSLNGNEKELQLIEEFYSVSINKKVEIGAIKSKRIWNRVYLHFDTRFIWPDLSNPYQGEKGTCYALSTHIGILADGRVVPCCLDKEGVMVLGNCLEKPLTEILDSEEAHLMLDGFRQGKLIKNLCQHCSYAVRFSKKLNKLKK